MPVWAMGSRKGRVRRKRVAAALAVVVVGTATGLLISSAVASSSPGYVTAAATVTGVSQTLPLTGEVEPVNNVQADFQVAGTVSAVDVTMGQQVVAGQKLATIDPTSLQLDVTSAQAVLTAAEAKLTADEENQSSGGSSSSGIGTASAVQGGGSQYVLTSVTVPSRKGGAGSLSSDQQAVVAGQHDVDSALQASAAALRQAQSVCSGSQGPGGTTTTSTSTSTSTSTTSTTMGSSGSGGGGTPDAACVTALGQAEQAALKVGNAEQALAGAESNLAQLLSKTSSSAGSKTAEGQGGPSTAGQGSSSKNTVNTDTPQQLASDQATIDSDQASLVVAQQDLTDAVLTAPISGTVVRIGLSAGQPVGAGSTSDAITIISAGTYEVDATVTTAQVSKLANGETATVTVNGTTGTFDGTVTRVGPVQESNGSYTYPLVIDLGSAGVQFPAGADAQLTVNLRSASSALVVPTSAVHTNGATSYVLVPKGGSEQEQRVTVGVVGAVYTQITAGLSNGATVILANPSTKVPSSSTASNTGAGATRTFTGGFTARARGG